jgi:uncharacterized radical SAM superfamily protein
MISGGTPRPEHSARIDRIYEALLARCEFPTDVMLAPRTEDDLIERLGQWNVNAIALNIEVFDQDIARRLIPQKHEIGLSEYAAAIEKALDVLGGGGRVRSLILVGLEPPEQTLAGVTFLARLGCDPVLSPFRPAPGTPLAHVRPPSPALLETVYSEARDIVHKYGVTLGPRCIPCQNNTLTLPDGSDDYFFH